MYTTIKLYAVAEPEIYSLGIYNLFELSVIISFYLPWYCSGKWLQNSAVLWGIYPLPNTPPKLSAFLCPYSLSRVQYPWSWFLGWHKEAKGQEKLPLFVIGSGGGKRRLYWKVWWLILCDNVAWLWCSDSWSNFILDVFVKLFFFWGD